MTGRLHLAALLAAAVACGAPSPPPAPRGPVDVARPPSSAPDPAPLGIEYVVLPRRWVEKHVPTPAPEVKAWSEDPANVALVGGSLRHILFKVEGEKSEAAARKKAEAVLARVMKGEDFAKLAKAYSDDPASKDRGGEYPARDVASFVEPVRSAFEALAPGQTHAALVRSTSGLHIVKKDRAEGEELDRAYRKAKASEAGAKLAEALLAKMKEGAPLRRAIAESTESVLGERAAADASRPQASIVDRERLAQARLPAAAKAALQTFARGARAGDVLPSPAVDGDVTVVARAIAPGGDY